MKSECNKRIKPICYRFVVKRGHNGIRSKSPGFFEMRDALVRGVIRQDSALRFV